MSAQVKRIYYFGAGVALGVAATRRTRRAKEAAREALKVFLDTKFEGGRHANRVAKLSKGCTK